VCVSVEGACVSVGVRESACLLLLHGVVKRRETCLRWPGRDGVEAPRAAGGTREANGGAKRATGPPRLQLQPSSCGLRLRRRLSLGPPRDMMRSAPSARPLLSPYRSTSRNASRAAAYPFNGMRSRRPVANEAQLNTSAMADRGRSLSAGRGNQKGDLQLLPFGTNACEAGSWRRNPAGLPLQTLDCGCCSGRRRLWGDGVAVVKIMAWLPSSLSWGHP
jgi:hypothetical protein